MPTKQRDLSKEDWGVMGTVNYRGHIIWRSGEGYNMGGNYYPSQKELDKRINEGCEIISSSITVDNNNGSISITNVEIK